MSEFKKTVLTEKGLALLAKGQAGAVINFERLVIGDGAYTGDLTKLTSLQNETKTLPILSISVDGVTTKLKGQLDNSGVLVGYFIREIGVIATDPDEGEILYAVSNVGDGTADYIPPEASNIVEEIFEFVTKIENADNVTASLDSSLAYASKNEVELVANQVSDLEPKLVTVDEYELGVSVTSNLSRIFIMIPEDVVGGPITIKKNGDAPKPLLTPTLDPVTELLLETMFFLIIENDDKTAFILAPAGAKLKGDAQDAHVLSGKTFSNKDGNEGVGSMPIMAGSHDVASVQRSGNTLIFPITGDGYHTTDDKLQYTENDWVESNIKKDVNMFGKTGSLVEGVATMLPGASPQVMYTGSIRGFEVVIKDGYRYVFNVSSGHLQRQKYTMSGTLVEHITINASYGDLTGTGDAYHDVVAFYNGSDKYRIFDFDGTLHLNATTGASNSAWYWGCNRYGHNIKNYYDYPFFTVHNSGGTELIKVSYCNSDGNSDNKAMGWVNHRVLVYSNVYEVGVVVFQANGQLKHVVFNSNSNPDMNDHREMHSYMQALIYIARLLGNPQGAITV